MNEKRKTFERNEEEFRNFNPESYLPLEAPRQREECIPFPQYQAETIEKESFRPLQVADASTVNPTETGASTEQAEQKTSTAKRTDNKQRRMSLEEYRAAYLQVPRIEDRKPVFVSREVRDRLDEIVRRLGGRRMSVSGLLENMARLHIATYQDDIEQWRKL